MRLGLITDVHSNTDALSAVLAALEKDGVDTIVHLGDAVGYGAEPNEICDVLRQTVQVSLMGNHDAAVLGQMDTAWFSPHAKAVVEWTREQLSPENMAWLEKATWTFRESVYYFCHGSPADPAAFRYVLSWLDAREIFQWSKEAEREARVFFVGHAHQCLVFNETMSGYRVVDGVSESELELGGDRWVINVGSVGQPRDGDPRACYGILDTGRGLYQAKRVAYDFESAGAKIRAARLPDVLGARLALGR